MVLVLVESHPDPASVGIAAALHKKTRWEEDASRFEGHTVWRAGDACLVRTDKLHIECEHLDAALREAGIEARLIVFLSKHRSESGRPTLTAHPVGNYADAALGGQPRRVTPVSGPHLTHMLRCLAAARARHGYAAEVSFESTHHGPLLSTPAFFVELGSAESQWNDPAGHEVLAEAVAAFLESPPPEYPVAIGLGGGHYSPRFTEAALTKQIHYAHLVPSHYAEQHPEPREIAADVVRASPGAKLFHVHEGTLKRATRDRWAAAFETLGLKRAESKEWPALPVFEEATNNALSGRPEWA